MLLPTEACEYLLLMVSSLVRAALETSDSIISSGILSKKCCEKSGGILRLSRL